MPEIIPEPVLIGGYAFFVEGIPPLPNRTRGEHYMQTYKTKEEWENRIGWLAKAKRIPLMTGRAHVRFIIQVGSNRKIDPDNLMWAVCKPSLDTLQKVGILRGDSIDDVELSFVFNREKPKGFWIEIKPL